MSDERNLKLTLLSMVGGDVDRAKAMIEWLTPTPEGEDFETGFNDSLNGLVRQSTSKREAYWRGQSAGDELRQCREELHELRSRQPTPDLTPAAGAGEGIPEGFTKWEGGVYSGGPFVGKDVEVLHRDGRRIEAPAASFTWSHAAWLLENGWKHSDAVGGKIDEADDIIAYRILADAPSERETGLAEFLKRDGAVEWTGGEYMPDVVGPLEVITRSEVVFRMTGVLSVLPTRWTWNERNHNSTDIVAYRPVSREAIQGEVGKEFPNEPLETPPEGYSAEEWAESNLNPKNPNAITMAQPSTTGEAGGEGPRNMIEQPEPAGLFFHRGRVYEKAEDGSLTPLDATDLPQVSAEDVRGEALETLATENGAEKFVKRNGLTHLVVEAADGEKVDA